MKKILYINGNPQKETLSFSRRAGQYFLEKIKATSEEAEIEVINTYEANIPLIDDTVLSAWASLRSGTEFSDLSSSQQEKISSMSKLLEQFKNADEYVFVTPLWNLGIPPMLKAYVDNIMIAGETFKYTEDGPVGLMTQKKATIIQASGGLYSKGPAQSMEHGSNYMKVMLGFIGVDDVDTILVEGVAIPDKSDEERLGQVYKEIDDIFAS